MSQLETTDRFLLWAQCFVLARVRDMSAIKVEV